MRIVVTSSGSDLSAPTSPVFGRCPMFVFVDTDTMEFEARENPALDAPGGAGVRAAEYIVAQGGQALVTGNVGPNAFQVLESAQIPVYLFEGGSVGEAVEAFREGRLRRATGASAREHAGMGSGPRSSANPAGQSAGSREQRIADLRQKAFALRAELADLMDRIDQLEAET